MKKTKIKHYFINTWFDLKHKSSFCWRYFGDLLCEVDNKRKVVYTDQVFCNACLTEAKEDNDEISFALAKIRSYSKTVSTGNLNRHLRDVHNIFENVSTKTQKNVGVAEENKSSHSSRPSVVATTSSSTKMRDSWLLARDMALWYCKSLIPLDSVSDEGTIDFFHKYEIISEKEDMPSKESVTRTALADIYESMMINIKAQIATDEFKHATIACEFWKNRFRHYITFVIHYLTDDFLLKSFSLCTKIFNHKEPEESIQKLLNDTIQCFGLEEKEFHFVTNAESNVQRTISILGFSNHSCLGQGLNKLLTVDGINSILELHDFAKKCTQIVKIMYYNLSDVERHVEKEQAGLLQMIEQVAENLEKDTNDHTNDDEDEDSESVPNSTPTRWYNLLAMLESLSQFGDRHSVNNIMALINRDDLEINKQEWKVLQYLKELLKNIRDILGMLSAQNTSSLNLALVFHLEIKDILSSDSDEEIVLMSTLKNNMLSKLNERFPITDKIIVAALLDPRFISLNLIDTYLEQKSTTRAAFLSEQVRSHAKLKLTSSTKTATCTKSETPGPSSKESVLSKLLKKHSSSSSKLSVKLESDVIDQECWRYLATANANDIDGEDMLMYWRDKKNIFPMLSELARAILAIPATSSNSERVFTETGLTFNEKRSRLNPTHLNKMLFIHDNYLHIV